MSDRLALAEELLQEAVFRSRARQAAGTGLLGGKMAGSSSGPTNCGLGREAAVELDLSERAAEICDQLWPEGTADTQRLREVTRGWVVRQDALDRDRNHFMKAFRHEHGFDRTSYSPEQLAAFEDGLGAVNQKANEERRASAQQLLA